MRATNGLRQRSRDIDDIIAASGRILLVEGDTELDLEMNAPHLLQLKAAVRQILSPFRHDADVTTGRKQRHLQKNVVAGIGGDIIGQVVALERK